MNETELRSYAAIMREMDLSSLEISEGNLKIRMERRAGSVMNSPVQEVPVYAADSAFERENAGQEMKTASASNTHVVLSPLVGVFYTAPAENADPYVALGDTVHKGQTLGVVEAMKLMNEITAEEDGVIEEICVTNGHMVEYGTPLFIIRR